MTHRFAYPVTPYLPGSLAADGDTTALAAARAILRRTTFVHEKLDGVNVGVRPDLVRGAQFVVKDRRPTASERDRLGALAKFLARPLLELRQAGSQIQLYGEVLSGSESLTRRWHLFDVYDEEAGRFWPGGRTASLAEALGVPTPPVIGVGPFRDVPDVYDLLRQPDAGPPMEGAVLRVEEDGWLRERYKVVSPDFRQRAWTLS